MSGGKAPEKAFSVKDDEALPETDGTLRGCLREVVFGTRTFAGRAFDLLLIISIIASVIAVMAASVSTVRAEHGGSLRALEWGFTLLFTAEYLLRIWIARRPLAYMTSFFGVVDLLAIIPTYLSVLFFGAEYLVVVRVLRVLRVFRILKLLTYVDSAALLKQALASSRQKIVVFFIAVFSLVIIFGSIMYLVEGEAAGFTSIPISVYWAVVTLTTVGFGDITPLTPLGRSIATVIMLLGYAIIAVPTGIVTAAISRSEARTERLRLQLCDQCGEDSLRREARFCDHCGARLE